MQLIVTTKDAGRDRQTGPKRLLIHQLEAERGL